MTIALLEVAGVVAAAAGFFGMLAAVRAQHRPGALRGLRVAQAGMTVAGAVLIAAALTGGDSTGVFGGFLLLVFGTGLTDIRGRAGEPGRDRP